MNTMQQEFDAVVAHLYKQGKPAADRRGPVETCKYRLEEANGSVLKCAVGCRIPDSVYVPEMDECGGSGSEWEGTGINSLLERFGSVLPPEIMAYRGMFAKLQNVHDGSFDSIEELTEALAEVAEEYNLTFTAPEASDVQI